MRGKRAEKQNILVAVFFSKDFLRRRKFGQNWVFIVICENSENQFGRPKKSSIKFRIFFENPPPPLEKTTFLNLLHQNFWTAIQFWPQNTEIFFDFTIFLAYEEIRPDFSTHSFGILLPFFSFFRVK